MQNVLILSPHTDDAELGAGGTISRLIEEGKNLFWVVFSTAEESLPEHMAPDTLKMEFIEVINHFNIKQSNFKIFDFKVRYLHLKRQEILEELIKIRKDFKPDLVIGPSLKDHHQDHQVIAQEAVRAFKNSASIIGYEIPWNHITFDTQLFIKLDKRHLDRKHEILQKYQSQIKLNRTYFSKDYSYGLATVRGTQCNSQYAEAFEVIRWQF
ncbi:PIG-L family deacetylase [Candidatus Woesearchaeota archaeon]|nr:PIG-L family deacetylase [Candidatus Woesearchaeota archaeon]